MQCVQLVRVRAGAARTEVRIGVAGAGTSRTDWAGVEGAKFSMGWKGEGETLRWDIGVGAREDKLLIRVSFR